MPVADLARQTGISEQTLYRRKKHRAGMQSDQFDWNESRLITNSVYYKLQCARCMSAAWIVSI